MLINLSNHPSIGWDKKQYCQGIALFGSIVDMEFPAIDPEAGEEKLSDLAILYRDKILNLLKDANHSNSFNALHIQGEFTFVYRLVSLLKKNGIKCVASTSRRNKINGSRNNAAAFKFVKFREYS